MKYIKDNRIYNKVTHIVLNDMQIFNPTHEQILEAGYEVYEEPTPEPYEPTEEELLMTARQEKIAELMQWDDSNELNSFQLNGQQLRIRLDKRKDMRQSLLALDAENVSEFTYWNDDSPITLPVSVFINIMNKYEIYALTCYNITAQHKADIMGMSDVDAVKQYDVKDSYPEKLVF